MSMSEQQKHTCPECAGRMEEQLITHEYNQGEVMYLVQNVPAWVCVQCGDIFLEAAVIAALENVVQQSQPIKKIETPVYDFSIVKP